MDRCCSSARRSTSPATSTRTPIPDLLGGTVGFPSPATRSTSRVYPALFAGPDAARPAPRPASAATAPAVVDTLILTVGFALLSWVFLVAPNLHLSGLTSSRSASRSPIRSATSCCSAALIRFAVQAGSKTPAFYLLGASTVALLATDCAYNYALLAGTYNHQVIYDAGWIAYLVLWGAAALHPSMRTLEQAGAERRGRDSPRPGSRCSRSPA